MSGTRSPLRWLVAIVLWARARNRRPPAPGPDPDRRGERIAMQLLGGAILAAIAFIVAYFAEPDTQLLGLALGLALALMGAASVVASKRLTAQGEREERLPERGEHGDPEERQRAVEAIERPGRPLTRRSVLATATAGALATLAAALALPLASLGPVGKTSLLRRSPWRAGRRLLDDRGRPISADDLPVGSLVTAFPEGAGRRRLDAAVIVVRLEVDELDLSDGRRGWAAEGIVAYSKACTHAGCAVSMFRHPLHEPTSEPPALVCPCHFSVFDPARGAEVVSGPAGRPLPQLPLRLGDDGTLVADGDLSSPPGPSWPGVRT